MIDEIRALLRRQTGGSMPVYEEQLDLYQFSSPTYADHIQTFFREKYAGKSIGVIVAIGPGALRQVLGLQAGLWPDTQIVFAAVDSKAGAQGFPAGVTGTTMEMTLVGMIDAARMLMPDVQRFAIVGDRLEEQLYYQHFAEELRDESRRFEFIDLTGLSIDDLRRRVAMLPDETVILYTGINSKPLYSAADVVPLLSEVANRPIIVDVETYLGLGALGGFVLSPRQIGREAAQTVLRILGGERASDIPVTPGGLPKPIFDWRQMQRWNISANRLPPESEVRFHQPGLWDQYWIQILLAGAALTLQSVLISWLLYEQRRRRIAEVAARSTLSELAHVNRVATAGVLSASIAHEVSQPLTGIVANASAALRWLSTATPDIDRTRAALNRIVDAGHRAGDVIKSIRGMVRKEGGPRAFIDINNTINEVMDLVGMNLKRHQVTVKIQLDRQLPGISGDRVQLQQVVLNLVLNAIESMQSLGTKPRVLRVETHNDKPGEATVSVSDTGVGIKPDDLPHIFEPMFTTKSQGMGMGLSISRSIIEAHDGRLWASPNPGGGSVFQFTLPIAGER
jgi:signal transduction histidine kinase